MANQFDAPLPRDLYASVIMRPRWLAFLREIDKDLWETPTSCAVFPASKPGFTQVRVVVGGSKKTTISMRRLYVLYKYNHFLEEAPEMVCFTPQCMNPTHMKVYDRIKHDGPYTELA